jgi:hypothetical protein
MVSKRAVKEATSQSQIARGKKLSGSVKQLPVIMPAAIKPRHFTSAQIRRAVRKAAESE